MGSDHHPALVRLRNLRPTPGAGPGMREVWRTDKIPYYKDKDKLRTFVEAYQSAFSAWTTPAPKFMPSRPRKLIILWLATWLSTVSKSASTKLQTQCLANALLARQQCPE